MIKTTVRGTACGKSARAGLWGAWVGDHPGLPGRPALAKSHHGLPREHLFQKMARRWAGREETGSQEPC